MATTRDDFSVPVKDALRKRASFICSNPSCKNMTVAPSESSDDKVLYSGRAAHIYAAAVGGARYDKNMTPEQRSDITNAIFLCANCADIVDDNNGADFPPETLKRWKADHEAWVRSNLNKTVTSQPGIVINVQSQGQQGGITAGVVNIGSSERHLDDSLKRQLDKEFADPNESIGVFCATVDSEGYNFATEILGYMQQKGFKLSGMGQGTIGPPVKGVAVRKIFRNVRTIIVGFK
jgi:hypothetical protein